MSIANRSHLAGHAWKAPRVSIDSGHQLPSGSAGPFERAGKIRLLALCCVFLVAVVAADVATLAWSLRERVLLALVASLVMVAGLLLRRHRLNDQRLAAERRQLSIAVNNIPQGLVLYDGSARIITCRTTMPPVSRARSPATPAGFSPG